MIQTTAVKALGVLSISALVACGGSGSNPVTGGTVDTVVDPTNPNTVAGQKFAFDQTIGLVANSMTYDDQGTADTSDDTLNINNIPFDTETGFYNRVGTLPNGWGLYENDERGQAGRLDYTAVFHQSATGNVEGGVAASPNWTGSSGNAGAVVRRTNASVSLPINGIIQYNGTYGGIRELDNDANPTDPGIELVTGNAEIRIDFDDFDIQGDIVGFISGRQVYNADTGALVGTLSDVSLAESFIDRTDATIDESTASALDGTLSGTWEGVFGGANGEEVAAYLILNGTTPSTPVVGLPPIPGVAVRELGVLLVAQ
ncbi:hypothetical protein [Litoreibacter janthinus]|uniref:Transferrin-binding protein B C-lobe/N-lobe beta barrel domain-containing protein n=1 Tax=Litoreibacter janthinus TaxID=670154 RepID=A0A1I6HGM5_9RHOB|nr:hypothetical protein [Litoreibacter janthinus]SFR53460.1 hypothetical protein SAMN04488002_2973 [Litoreibacter janthinus]